MMVNRKDGLFNALTIGIMSPDFRIRQLEEAFAAEAVVTGAVGANHVACDTVNVEERRFHVCACRDSIRKHTKCQ